jgi:predicted Zn-dependent peptidase
VSIGVWITAGSRHEPARLNGITHLLEHMAFKGTVGRSTYDIAVSLESLGGHLNAFTEKEFTCYCALVLDEHLPQAVDVLTDLLQHPLLTESDLTSEKRIVAEEIRNADDTPEDRIHERFIQTVFEGHPMAAPILGSERSLRGIRRKDLFSHREALYTFQNCVVSAAGRVDHERLVRLVDSHLKHLSERQPEFVPPVEYGSSHRKTFSAVISQSHVCTGVTALAYDDPRKFPLIVLDTYFGGGMSSRLFQNLREDKGLAYSVYSFLDFWSDAGLWGVYTGTSPEAVERAIEAVRNEAGLLVHDGVPASALERVKSQIVGNLLLMFEDNGHRMTRLAKMEAYTQSYSTVESVIERIKSVTRNAVQETAEVLLDGKKPYTVVLRPKP